MRTGGQGVLAERVLGGAVVALASLLGGAAFLYPFFLPAAAASSGMMAHATDAPLVFVVVVLLSLVALFASVSGRQLTSKMVALLGILTAAAAALRVVQGPGGFSAVFLLPVLTGYAYGSTFGFLLGSLGLLVSALVGGGVGPWLPYQILAVGWVGLVSGWLPDMDGRRGEPALLAIWGAALGLVFGAIMNLWFWPYLTGGAGAAPGETWHPGLPLWATVRNYLAFYVATSLWWDAWRAAGNALLLLVAARPVLRVLRRFRRRFNFETLPALAAVGRE